MFALKKLLLFLLFFGLIMPGGSAFAQTNQSSFVIGSSVANINGTQTNCFATPYIKNSRTFLSIRDVGTALGITQDNIIWDATKSTITLIKGDKVVQVAIGSMTMLINGVAVTMDVAPELGPERSMLPVAWIANAFGAITSYNDATQTVTIQLSGVPNSETLPSNISPNNLSEITVPSLAYRNIQTENKNFEWNYGGKTFKWHVEVPSDLLNWDRQVYNITQQFYYNSNGLEQEQILNSAGNIKDLIIANSIDAISNYVPMTNETVNSQWVGYLAKDLDASAQAAGYDYFHEADFILSFIGSAIPYTETEVAELPAQTLIDSGDCKDKSILYASILKALGYKVVLLNYPTAEHEAVGVDIAASQLPTVGSFSYYLYNGSKYYFAETTEPNWTIGDNNGSIVQHSSAYVYAVN